MHDERRHEGPHPHEHHGHHGHPPHEGPHGNPPQDSCCDEHRHHHGEECHDECCEGPGPEGPRDTTEMMIGTWQHAFEQACHEVQVEILKERLRKSWGESMNSIADSVIELMLKDWQSSQGRSEARETREKAYQELVDKILNAYKQGPK
jgi:hypothetical protein